ncbi:MAG: competence protein TfoX [Clostridia bacterium]|nr:competence protein TfoX [Clostridia bacterium]
MASGREYLDFILEQLSAVDGIAWRSMMGEFILYCHGKVIGGIYDDRFLVKPVPAAIRMMPDAQRERPYEGAAEMILVDRLEDRDFLRKLLEQMEPELPEPKRKKAPLI